jgi:hypothetical protein
MNFLKGLGTFISSFLIFLSLSVFGLAYLVHSTALSPRFVTSQVDKVDVSALARDVAEKQISGKLPEEALFIKEAVYKVIDDQEPWLKKQLDGAINTGYDFLLGKSNRLEFDISLKDLKADLKDSLWATVKDKIAQWLPDVQNDLTAYLNEHFKEYLAAIPREYLPPDIARLPENQLRLYVDQYIQQANEQILKGLQPQVSGLLEALIKPYFDQYYDEVVADVPDVVAVHETDIPSDVMSQLLLAKKYIGYFQTGYYALIGFMVVLAALIFLINRNVKDTARTLGIDLIVYGALELAGVLLARSFNPVKFLPDIASSLDNWLTGLYSDVLMIMQWFSIIILVIGVALLVVSIIYKPRGAED